MKKTPTTVHNGKGGGQEILPNRHAMSKLVGGNPAQRSLGNYARMTPADADGSNTPNQNILTLPERDQ